MINKRHIYIFLLIFFILDSFSLVYSITSNELFNFNINSINLNPENKTVQLYVNFENRIGKKLFYDVEIKNKNTNSLVFSKSIISKTPFSDKFNLNFSSYSDNFIIYVTVLYNDVAFQKNVSFNLSSFTRNKFKVLLQKKYYLHNGEVNISGKILELKDFNNFKNYIKTFNVSFWPNSLPQYKRNITINCFFKKDLNLKICNFNFVLSKGILLDNYTISIQNNNYILTKNFLIEYKENNKKHKLKKEIKTFNLTYNSSIEKNVSFEENNMSIIKNNNGNDKNKNLMSHNIFKKNSSINYSEIKKNIILSDVPIKFKTKTINFSNLSRTNKTSLYYVLTEKHVDGSSSKKLLVKYLTNLENYTPNNGTSSIEFVSQNITRRINFKPKLKVLDIRNSPSIKSSFINFSKNHPSILSKKKFLFFGNEYYAYGLVSMNTEHSIYNKGEIVKFIIVVLDKDGYLVKNANLVLNIKRPDGLYDILSTNNNTIFNSSKPGVYFGFYNVSMVGKYNLFLESELNDLILEYNSYLNVVNNKKYDIIRYQPSTIDPWQGEYKTRFKLIFNISKTFDFVEKIPSKFKIGETNANQIVSKNNFTYIIWNNISENYSPYYFAQSPLLTPYLYEIGKAKIFVNNKSYYENKTWVLALDPIVLNETVNTCSNSFGVDCSAWPSSDEPDDTFDNCPTSKGGDGDEYVIEAYVNQTEVLPGRNVTVSCKFDPYSSGDEVYIYYYNGTWHQVYSGNAPGSDIYILSVNYTVDNTPGKKWFRCIIDWDGENDNCADQGNWYDNDDVYLNVFDQFLFVDSPQNISYENGGIDTIFRTNNLSNISYKIDNDNWKIACNNCNSFSGRDYYVKGNHQMTVFAKNLVTGKNNTYVVNFYVENSEVNPTINTSEWTCSKTFGFNCSDWPSSDEGDNTFDSCPTSEGSDGDEYVVEDILNQTSAYVNSSINVTCVFDPYSSGDEEYIYYYNGSGWKQLYSGNAPGSDIHNVSVITRIDNITGDQWFRCIIDWDGENDNCADGGNYYDNDDVKLVVFRYDNNTPFVVSVMRPENITYNQSEIPLEFGSTQEGSLEYALDDDSYIQVCDNCTYYNGSLEVRDGNHILKVRAYNNNTDTYVYDNVSFIVKTPPEPILNYSEWTCSKTFGFNCSDWPSSDEGDNTFDSCPTSKGGSGDEYVVEDIINSTVAYVNSSINVTCVFDPYSSGDEEYIYYYNGSGWKQLYSGNSPSSDIHNVSVIAKIDNITGDQWFRCIIDWDGENDNCADGGNYYDNDDVKLVVTRPIKLELFVYKPISNVVYTTEYVPVDLETTKNVSLFYKINEGNLTKICDNCSSYNDTFELPEGNYSINFSAIINNTNEIVWKVINFTIKFPKVDSINFRLPTPADDSVLNKNYFSINLSIYAENSSRFNLSNNTNSSVWYSLDNNNISLNCTGTNPDFNCFTNVSNLLSKSYLIKGCMKNNFGNITCTEIRNITINLPHKIYGVSLFNNVKFINFSEYLYNFTLYNMNNYPLNGSSLNFYFWIPLYFKIYDINYINNSEIYNISKYEENLTYDNVTGVIYNYQILPISDNIIFLNYSGNLNKNNSFNINFKINKSFNYNNFNKIIFGFN